MLILLVVLVVALSLGIGWTISRPYSEGGFWIICLSAIALMFVVPLSFKWKVSNDNLTGYVYQRNEAFGYASYSLRFSQNAGTDSQPSFCVKAGSAEDKKIAQYVGTDSKVRIETPSSNLRFENNLWACSSESRLTEVIKGEN